MKSEPIICFGQQPAGFFPKRFLYAKIDTARKLREQIDGKIVFFYHDSDADYRETITVMRDLQTGAEVRLNFTQENKIQKKFSPLYAKRIPAGWKEEILKQLPRFIDTSLFCSPFGGDAPSAPEGQRGSNLIEIFKSVNQAFVADFCLEMYRKMGLLDGIELVRSSDKKIREQASELAGEYFADVEYQGETVRAKTESAADSTTPSRFAGHPSLAGGEAPRLSATPRSSPPFQGGVPPTGGEVVGVLHEGGEKYIRFSINKPIEKWQKNPNRDQRFAWMDSVIHPTHYIYGEGEKEYLDVKPFPHIKFIDREKIDRADYAWLDNP